MRSLTNVLRVLLIVLALFGVGFFFLNMAAPAVISSIPVISDLRDSLAQSTSLGEWAFPLILLAPAVAMILLEVSLFLRRDKATKLPVPSTEDASNGEKVKKQKTFKPRYKRGKDKGDALVEGDVKPLIINTSPLKPATVEVEDDDMVKETAPEPTLAQPKTLPQIPVVTAPAVSEIPEVAIPEEVEAEVEDVEIEVEVAPVVLEDVEVEPVATQSEPEERKVALPPTSEVSEPGSEHLSGLSLPPIPQRPSVPPVIAPPPIIKPPTLK